MTELMLADSTPDPNHEAIAHATFTAYVCELEAENARLKTALDAALDTVLKSVACARTLEAENTRLKAIVAGTEWLDAPPLNESDPEIEDGWMRTTIADRA